MATLLNSRSHFWKFFILIFVYVVMLLSCFMAFQYRRERYFKVSELDGVLQMLNISFSEAYAQGRSPDSFYADNERFFHGLRLTIIDTTGRAIYDSEGDTQHFESHLDRQEVADALRYGKGYTKFRFSESTHNKYFYSALLADGLVFRSALPYSHSLHASLQADKGFIVFISLLFVLVTITIFFIARKLDRAIVREEERERNKMRQELTNNINHELKTPVSSIQGYMETLIAHPDIDPEVRMSFVEKSYQQTQRLTNLLHDVATITRMDEASHLIEKETLDVTKVINDIFSDLQMQAKARGITLNTNCIEPLMMSGNAMLLESVFRNLVDNALSYSGGREVHVELVEATRYRLYFMVYDNGNGVDERHFEHLFDRFYRVDKGRSRKEGGTGLGLSIVKNAVKFHGGEISVRNRTGGGLQFDFSLRR